MARSGFYRLKLSNETNSSNAFPTIKKNLDTMKEGELRHIRTGKGPQGLVTVRKLAPKTPSLGNFPVQRKAKVIR